MLTLNKLILGATVGAVCFAGCTSLKTETTKTYFDKTVGTNVVDTTKSKITTFFDAKSALSKLKNSITPVTSGLAIGELNQESSGSNTVQTVKILIEQVPVGKLLAP